MAAYDFGKTHITAESLAREMLADSEAMLLERVVSLEADVRIYRELAQQGIHALHAMTLERDRLTARLRHLRGQLHALRDAERRAA